VGGVDEGDGRHKKARGPRVMPRHPSASVIEMTLCRGRECIVPGRYARATKYPLKTLKRLPFGLFAAGTRLAVPEPIDWLSPGSTLNDPALANATKG
jgi:hypothetical protein